MGRQDPHRIGGGQMRRLDDEQATEIVAKVLEQKAEVKE